MKFYSYSLQGLRDSNEDQHICISNIDGKEKKINKLDLIGVFDGHGGKLVSKFLQTKIPKIFLKDIKTNSFFTTKESSKTFNEIFTNIQNKLIKKHPRAVNYCGSTALCGVIVKNPKTKKKILWIANVGDSRAIMCNYKNEPIQLSKDHKPNDKKEKKRIYDLGGNISFDGSDWRVKDLSLSRAIGDLECKPYVSHMPEIFKYNIKKTDKYLVFGCDGLWDVMSNNDVIEYINGLFKKNYKGNYAKKLTEKAIKEGSLDNVSVVIGFFD